MDFHYDRHSKYVSIGKLKIHFKHVDSDLHGFRCSPVMFQYGPYTKRLDDQIEFIKKHNTITNIKTWGTTLIKIEL